MRLYFVGHGESEANKAKMHAGWAPVHLTDKGIEDAKRAGRLLNGIKFDAVYCSDLVRVRETCLHAIGEENPILRTELREMNVGSLAGKYPSVLSVELGEKYKKDYDDRDFHDYGGENLDDIYERVASFMADMEKEENAKRDRILAFASEGAIDMALMYVIGRTDGLVWNVRCSNGSVSVFSYESGKWRLETWNYIGNI